MYVSCVLPGHRGRHDCVTNSWNSIIMEQKTLLLNLPEAQQIIAYLTKAYRLSQSRRKILSI